MASLRDRRGIGYAAMNATLLDEPRLRGVQPGTAAWFSTQQDLIGQRPLLKRTYDAWYHAMLADEASVPAAQAGEILELGSGPSVIKRYRRNVITSDIVTGLADRVVDAQALPFAKASLRAILLTHCFHHIPDVARFLEEAQRVLVPGGVVSMVEVAHTPLARFFFRRFHPEPYDDRALDWALPAGEGYMHANQALSWNVLVRDRQRFASSFPDLRFERARYLPWAGYLLSGGVTRRNLMPRPVLPLVRALETATAPLRPALALHWHLTLRHV